MAVRRPLVRDPVSGELTELPLADSLPGAGGGGGSLTKGIALIDFGAAANDMQFVAIAEATVTASSVVLLSIDPSGTADHSADEHLIESFELRLGEIRPGVGFDIWMVAGDNAGLEGKWGVRWALAA
jgi:hypothetical protein